MSEIVLKVQAPELAAAIATLAAALSGSSQLSPAPVQPPMAPASSIVPPVTPVAAVSPSAPVQQPKPAVTSSAAPALTPVSTAPPVVPVAAAPTYSRDQIMTAGAALIDAGKINELMGLLNAFGVQAVTQLGQEQLGVFATELRKLGAQI